MISHNMDCVILSFVLGCVLIVLIYHLILYFFLRDKLYVYFCTYLVFVILFILSSNYFLSKLQLTGLNYENYFLIHEVFAQTMFGSYILYVMQAFGFNKNQHYLIWKLSRALFSGIILYIVIFPLSYHKNYSDHIFLANRIFLFIMGSWLILSSFKIKNNPVLKYIQLATIIYFLLTLASFIVLTFNIMSEGVLPLMLVKLAIIIDLVIFSAALAKRSHEKILAVQEKLHTKQLELQSIEHHHEIKMRGLQDKERQRISMDLHDDLGATLTSIKFITSAAKRNADHHSPFHFNQYEKIELITNQVLDMIGDIIWSLGNKAISLDTIEKKALNYIYECNQTNSINYLVNIPKTELNLNSKTSKYIWLILKEGINNIHKHSNATMANIEIEINDTLSISIKDDGIGLPENITKGNGVKNIETRVKELGGSISIDPKNIKGTAIIINIPLTNISD